MKKVNAFLAVVLFLMLAFVAYFMIGGTLRPQVSVASAPAMDHLDACASIQNIVNSGAAPQQFQPLPSTPEGCTLVDATITLSNIGLFDAEWIDISVKPAEGDIAVYSLTGETSSLPSRTYGQVNLKLLTTAPAGTTRTVTLSYYVFGMMRQIEVPV